MNKRKIINDPVYGLISIPYDFLFDIIQHPYFQRLRNIQQLGLTSLVYPGAVHTRFHHAIGAMHLMSQAIETLRTKNVEITDDEALAVTIAILLHDIGHGPFSHALENSIIPNLHHETLSEMFMQQLNIFFDGKLTMAIQIFKNEYPKKFLHQLVSSQLDMDRLDYLTRDSFFTGVQEGVVGFDRIIKMLDVKNNELIVEHKGIYSIEKFLIARRLMYWQVYLHKTVISAEMLLLNILKRAKYLSQHPNKNHKLFATNSLAFFLKQNFELKNVKTNPEILENFAELDDHDIYTSIKMWQHYQPDFVLSQLCKMLTTRKLYKVEMANKPFLQSYIEKIEQQTVARYGIEKQDVSYFVFENSTSNYAYNLTDAKINIALKNKQIIDIIEASDLKTLESLTQPVTKYFLCYPKEINF